MKLSSTSISSSRARPAPGAVVAPAAGDGWAYLRQDGVGARIHLVESQEVGFIELTIGACPAFPIERAAVQLSVPDKVLLEEQVDLTPIRRGSKR